jgi:hypothetical protein
MKYFALSNISHDGKNYGRGDAIDLSDKAAEELLEAGVIQTEKVADAPKPVAPVPEDTVPQPKAGGEPTVSGEPSLDRQDEPAQRTEAADVTPVVSESMTRKEVDEIAAKEGVEQAAVEAAATKADVVALIEDKRADKPASAEREVDASADL